ncbi:MAG: methyltransferase family protein [Candidatus Hodarchaeota archaeon]
MIEWINFISLIINLFLFSYFYILSVQPAKRETSKGNQAWRECKQLRIIASLFEIVLIVNMIVWIWFPIPLVNWKIHKNYIISILLGVTISVPFVFILLKAINDAGKETVQPSKETQMYGGIYKYIRHPQSLGEFPLFITIAIMINSWFILALMLFYIILYVPIMIYYEEQDLVRRFGEQYKQYQQRTGALFPKIRKQNYSNKKT